jgi:TetR/AcrR family transcriptional regulator, tetracycline repressor protein
MARASNARQREPLSREEIVRSALAVADGEGLDAVTVRRIAADHGVTHMALYWHFRGKEQLLNGIAEYLFAQIQLPPAAESGHSGEPGESEPWDRRLFSTLSAMLAVLRPHPAAAQLAPARVLSSDAGLRIAEHVLGILREAGFSGEQSAVIATQLLMSVIALVTGHPGPSRGDDPQGYEAAIRARTAALTALDPAQFPNVTGIAAPLASCADDDSYYDSGLELLTGGVRAMAASLARP